MYGVRIPAGWADTLEPGDHVIVQNRYVTSHQPSAAYRQEVVESVSARQVVVNGIAYRRGKGRSKYVEYQNEGFEIAALNRGSCGRIYPVTPETLAWVADLAAADQEASEASRLAAEITKAAKAAKESGDLARLRAAHAELVDP